MRSLSVAAACFVGDNPPTAHVSALPAEQISAKTRLGLLLEPADGFSQQQAREKRRCPMADDKQQQHPEIRGFPNVGGVDGEKRGRV